jgi:hypothetical protein
MICDPEKIDQLGIVDGINEVIVTTRNTDGVPNAAPLGIIKNKDALSIRLFLGSHTYENIMTGKRFVANVTHDPRVFVETALGDIDDDRFKLCKGELALKEAECWALFKCNPVRVDISLPKIEFVKGEVLREDYRAVNRGSNLVIEAAVAATRYVELGSEKYLDDLFNMGRIVRRCGGPRDIEAMDLLEEILEYLGGC